MVPDQLAKLREIRLGDVDPGPASREVNARRKVEVSQQTVPKRFNFLQSECLRIEVTAATIATATAIVHVPDGNTECRVEIGYDVLRDAFDALLSVEQLEKLIEMFGCSGDETVMNVRLVGARIGHLDTPWRRWT
jgi:hypothetical protein